MRALPLDGNLWLLPLFGLVCYRKNFGGKPRRRQWYT